MVCLGQGAYRVCYIFLFFRVVFGLFRAFEARVVGFLQYQQHLLDRVRRAVVQFWGLGFF